MRLRQIAVALALSTLTSLSYLSPARAVDCEGLKSAKISDTTIISAEAVPAGDLTTADKVTRKDMPAFCRVVASVKDAPELRRSRRAMDAERRMEGRLPRQRQRRLRGRPRLQLRGDGSRDQARLRLRGDRSRDGAGDPAQRRRAHRASGQVERLGHAGDPRGGGRRESRSRRRSTARTPSAPITRAARRAVSRGSSKRNITRRTSTAFIAGAPVVSRTWGHAVAVTSFQAANLKPGHKLSDAKLALAHQVGGGRLRRQGQRPQVRSVHRRPAGLRLRSRRSSYARAPRPTIA